MKKSILAASRLNPLQVGQGGLLRLYAFTVVAILTGCMATQNRWQATQMRQQVMNYYNDQIMENLIRAKESLPFVHVDVTSLTTTDAASLASSIGDGETSSFNRTRASGMAAALSTIARGVTRPFSYSVTPTRNTSLQIIASPAFGEVAPMATPTPTPTSTPEPPPPNGPALMLSPRPTSTLTSVDVKFDWSSGSASAYRLLVGSANKEDHDIYDSGETKAHSATVNNLPADGRPIYVTLSSKINGSWISNRYQYTASSFQASKITQSLKDSTETATETELTPTPVPTPKPFTVYDLYENFVNRRPPALASTNLTPPKSGYVPGTIKRWGIGSRTKYYYIPDDKVSKEAYYTLCKSLFTKGKAQSIESKVEQISQREGQAAAERAFLSR